MVVDVWFVELDLKEGDIVKLSEVKYGKNVVYKIVDDKELVILIESASGEVNSWFISKGGLNAFTIGNFGDHVEMDDDGNEIETDDWNEAFYPIESALDEINFVKQMITDHLK
jgi:hypothetical protein